MWKIQQYRISYRRCGPKSKVVCACGVRRVCCTRQTQRRPGVKSGCWAGLWDFGTTLRKVWGKFDMSLKKIETTLGQLWDNCGWSTEHVKLREEPVWSQNAMQDRYWWEVVGMDIITWCWNLKLVIRFGTQHMIRSHWQLIRSKLGFYFSSGITLYIDVIFLLCTFYWSIEDKTYKKVERNPF